LQKFVTEIYFIILGLLVLAKLLHLYSLSKFGYRFIRVLLEYERSQIYHMSSMKVPTLGFMG